MASGSSGRLTTQDAALIPSLIEELVDGVVLFDRDKKVVFSNTAASRMTGLPREGFFLSELAMLFTERTLIDSAINRSVETGELTHIPEAKLFRSFYELFITPVIDAQQQVEGGAVVLHDVSYYQREKELLESVGDGIVAIDQSFMITFFNNAAGSVCGWAETEAIGKPFHDLFSLLTESGVEDVAFINDSMLKGVVTHMEGHAKLVTKQGRDVYVSCTAAPVFDSSNGVAGAIIVFRDVTKERELDRAKSEFISLASHQLKLPPTAVRWNMEILLKGTLGRLTKDQRDMVKATRDVANKMVDTVNVLLNASRLELGTFIIDPQPLAYGAVAREVVGEFSAQIKKKKITVKERYSRVPKIPSDPGLAKIIIENVFSNAVKYTPKGGKISIQIALSVDGGRQGIQISVSDNGYGIPKEAQAKIFSKMFRAENIRDKEDGTGFGLYLLKSIVDLAEGRVWFESEEGSGTTFYTFLPLEGMKKRQGTSHLT